MSYLQMRYEIEGDRGQARVFLQKKKNQVTDKDVTKEKREARWRRGGE